MALSRSRSSSGVAEIVADGTGEMVGATGGVTEMVTTGAGDAASLGEENGVGVWPHALTTSAMEARQQRGMKFS